MKSILRKYEVTVSIDIQTYNPIEECWRDADRGLLDRIEGPARLVFNPVSGRKLKEIFYQLGKLHRDEKQGPTVREWDSQGRPLIEAYYMYGRLHRSDRKPALIFYDPESGKMIEEKFYTFDRGEINPKTGRRLNSQTTYNLPSP